MTRRRGRFPWRRRRGDGEGAEPAEAGYTLVELVVVMVVAAIVMAMLIPFVASVSRAAQTTVAYQQATATGRVALQDLAVQLSSASEVCLLDTSGAAPTAATLGSCPTPTTSDGLEILTSASGTSHWVQWWYEAPFGGGNGLLESQTWLDGQSPATATTTVVAGTPATNGLSSCSIGPGSGGLFTVTPASPTARASATISLSITCTASRQSATVSMQTTVSALNTSVTGG